MYAITIFLENYIDKEFNIFKNNYNPHISLFYGKKSDSDKKKIIAALTIENKEDVKKYKDYKNISEIILFDSKGYEKSMSFDRNLLDEVEDNIEKMIAGNIKIENVTDFKNKNYILDVSGSLESSKGVKDINKIDKFLNTVHNINS